MAMVTGVVRRGEIFFIDLNPARGEEIRTTRPCVVVSPDELNAHLRTFVVAPLATGSHPYPYRIPCIVRRKRGHTVLDQLRTVDRERLVGRAGRLDPETLATVLAALQEMFAP